VSLSAEAPTHASSSLWPRVIVIIAFLISLVMMSFVYTNLSPTWDEPYQMGNGLSWLTPPHHMVDPTDPPLGRVSDAIGPWLFGAKIDPTIPDAGIAGNVVLRQSGHYRRTATLARMGTLIWFTLSVYLVWSTTRRWLGEWPAALACVMFIFCPPILASASLATTDFASMATVLLAMDRIWIALRSHRWQDYAWAGAALGLACCAKSSALPWCLFFALVCLAYLWRIDRKLPQSRDVALIIVIVMFIIWAAYRFQVGSVAARPNAQAQAARLAEKAGPLRPAVTFALNHVPAYQFFRQFGVVKRFSSHPSEDYFVGSVYTRGRWYFFFLMVLVKTPIPLLILGLWGMWLAFRRLPARTDPFAIVPIAGFFVPMLIMTASHIFLGIRHVLIVYAFLAMLSALAAKQLMQLPSLSKIARQCILAVLVAWNVLSCILATPDFIPWYNEAAAPWATSIHVDSDYDWGQDLSRLSKTLHALSVDQVWIAYNGKLDFDQFNLPPWKDLPSGVPKKGWIAISEATYRIHPADFGWLDAYKPVAIAGKSIRIYRID
jgi:hypothetical protein